MTRATNVLQPEDVEEPSVTERGLPRAPIDKAEARHGTPDSGDEQGPTSSHEDQGWRALKPF